MKFISKQNITLTMREKLNQVAFLLLSDEQSECTSNRRAEISDNNFV